MNEPISGAVLSGPTLYNNMRNDLVAVRQSDSPEWQPIVDGGRTVRWTGKDNALDKPQSKWLDTKVIYNQHPNDPVGYFSFDLAWRSPDWLDSRGPEVPSQMRWVPILTMWQVAADLPAAASVPQGQGHNYSRDEMTFTWAAMTDPDDWSQAKHDQLQTLMQQ